MARVDELSKPRAPEGDEGAMEVDPVADAAAIMGYHERALRDGIVHKMPEEILKGHRAEIERLKAEKVANLSDAAKLSRCDQHIQWKTAERDKAAEKLTKMREEYKALAEKWAADLRETEADLVAKTARVAEWVAAKEKAKTQLAASAAEVPAASGGGAELAALFATLREAGSALPEGVQQALAAAAGTCPAAVAEPAVVVENIGEGAAGANVGGNAPQAAAGSGGAAGNAPEDPERAKENEAGGGTDGGEADLEKPEDQSAFDAVLELLDKRADKGEPILKALRERSTPYGRR